MYGDNKAQAMEDLKKYYEETMDQLTEIEKISDDIREAYLDTIDEVNKGLKKQLDYYEEITDMLEHEEDVIKLLNGDDAYEELGKLYASQEENNLKQLDFLRQQKDFWKELMDSEEEGSEAWEEYKDNWLSATSELNSSVENSIKNLVDKYTNSINIIFEKLENKVTNGLGMDNMSKQWDLMKKKGDLFLDTITSIDEVNKIEDKYLSSLDGLSESAQKRLNDLMGEEIEMLREKDKLTQYDLDRANALYDIALKEVALEEAKQNKSSTRLTRDSQGNYAYTFVSDVDKITEAQQALEEAQNSLYDLDVAAYEQNLDLIYSTYSEFQKELYDLYADQTLTEEEREERKQMLITEYGEIINGLTAENESIRQNLQESTFSELNRLYGQNLDNIHSMSESEKDAYVDTFEFIAGVYNMNSEALAEMTEEEKALYGALFSEVADLYNLNIENLDSMTEEEKNLYGSLFANVAEMYNGNVQNLTDMTDAEQALYQGMFDNVSNMYTNNIDMFKNMTEEQKNMILGDMVPTWNSGVQNMVDAFSGEGGFEETVKNSLTELDSATYDYKTSMDELADAAGTNTDKMTDGYSEVSDAVKELIKDNSTLINKYSEQISSIKSVVANLEKLTAQYNSVKNAAIAAAEKANALWKTEQQIAAEKAAEEARKKQEAADKAAAAAAAAKPTTTTPSTSGSSSSSSGSSGGDGVPKVGETVTYTGGTYFYDSEGKAPSGNRGPGKAVKITNIKNGAKYPIHVESSNSAYGWLSKDQIKGFDTGGYTGDWSSKDGKLAFLHEKEIVLNKDDTKNILAAVGVIRSVADIVKALDMSVLERVGSLINTMAIDNVSTAKEKMVVEQDVSIEAVFPNVNTTKDIEDAFSNIINYASQKALEK